MRLGRYTLEGKLATGGMAEVFLARLVLEGGFERRVVIKRVLPQYARDPDFLRLFQQEARFASFLSHPHIAQVSDFGVDERGGAYLVMEYVDGASLRELIRRATALGERTDPRLLCRVFSQVAEALGAVHAATDPTTRAPLELIHRDVSPENVLLSRQGAVKLADFGIARAVSEVSTTSPDVVRGKVRYLAPEQVLGEPPTSAVDVWALGVTLFEALTLQRPFPEDNEGQTVHAIVNGQLRAPLEQLRPDLPDALVAIVRRCLARDPHQRFADCNDLALELERVSSSGGVTARLIGNWVERLLPEPPVLRPLEQVDAPVAWLPEVPAPTSVDDAANASTPARLDDATPPADAQRFGTPGRGDATPSAAERFARGDARLDDATPPADAQRFGTPGRWNADDATPSADAQRFGTPGRWNADDATPSADAQRFVRGDARLDATPSADAQRLARGDARLDDATPSADAQRFARGDARLDDATPSADAQRFARGDARLDATPSADAQRFARGDAQHDDATPSADAQQLTAPARLDAPPSAAAGSSTRWEALDARATEEAPHAPGSTPGRWAVPDERAPATQPVSEASTGEVPLLAAPPELVGGPTPELRDGRSAGRLWMTLALVVLALLGGAWALRPSGPPRRQVLITSTPSGASIHHGDRLLGATPWAGDLPRDEAVELVFTAPGRKETRRVLAPGDVAPVDVKLPR